MVGSYRRRRALWREEVPDRYLTLVGRSKDLIIQAATTYTKESKVTSMRLTMWRNRHWSVSPADFGEAVVAVVVAMPTRP